MSDLVPGANVSLREVPGLRLLRISLEWDAGRENVLDERLGVAALPLVDVPRVVAALQRAEATRHVRVVVTSERDADRDAALAAGAAAFVDKSVKGGLREVLDGITGLRA